MVSTFRGEREPRLSGSPKVLLIVLDQKKKQGRV